MAARVGRHEHPHRSIRASVPSDTSFRVVRYEPARVVTALAVMYFTLLRIIAGRVGALARTVSALSRKFCGMVGASNVVAGRVGALVVRVSALVVRVSALAVRVGA